jgi:polyferredoxin
MNIVERTKNILLKTSQTCAEIKNEHMIITEIYLSYVVILASIPAIAQFIGSAFIGYSVMGMHFRMGIGSALVYAIVSYIF